MTFEYVWKRIKEETLIKNVSQLAKIVGKTQPTISAKKKQGKEFPIEWAYLVGEKYNLATKWILTGEGPKWKIQEPRRRFLILVDNWLDKITESDPEREAWFKYHFLDSFPNFKDWHKEKEAEEKKHGRQSQTVREFVD